MRWTEFLCVPNALSSTNEQGIIPCNLIFGETDYFNLSVSVQSLPVPSKTFSRGCVILKIVYPICCGMDVHKSFVVACIASTNDHGVTTYKSKRFSTFTGDLRRCAAWLAENDCKDVCMESTGKYWIPIYNILEPTFNIVLAHPKYVKAIRGKKTDKRDAKWIDDIFKHDLVFGSFLAPLKSPLSWGAWVCARFFGMVLKLQCFNLLPA